MIIKWFPLNKKKTCDDFILLSHNLALLEEKQVKLMVMRAHILFNIPINI